MEVDTLGVMKAFGGGALWNCCVVAGGYRLFRAQKQGGGKRRPCTEYSSSTVVQRPQYLRVKGGNVITGVGNFNMYRYLSC